MERVFNKIVLVSLCDKFTKDVANVLAQNLGMMFCDTKDLIEYELIDKQAIETLCTKEYLKKSEISVLKHIASFENVVVSINFDYLSHNINILKQGSIIVFLKLSKNYVKNNSDAVEFIDYEQRTQSLTKIATATIDIRKTDSKFVCNKIINTLGGIL